jgi:ADP-ribose pyrophosphatase YjhB (NUDIX family)
LTEPQAIRQAVRGLVLDPDDRLLLVQVAFPRWLGWIAPGGGVVDGESDEAALRRELDEELELAGFVLGPLVWTRTHELRSARWSGQSERYFLIRTERFDPVPSLTWEQLNDEYVRALRWWTIDEIERSRESFAPRHLGPLLRSLVEDGAPHEPVDAGL